MTDRAPYRADIHHHFVPRVYREALERAGVGSVGGSPFPAWDEEAMRRRMDELKIRKAFLSVSAPGVAPLAPGDRPRAARLCNDAAAEVRESDPDRTGILATLPLPDVDATLAEIERCSRELRVDGFFVLTNADGVYLGDPRLEEVLAELNRRRAVVFVHPAIPPGAMEVARALPPAVLEFTFDTTRAMAELILRGAIDKFPDIRFVLAHLGGTLPFLAWRLSMVESSGRGVYADFQKRGGKITDYLRRFWYDTAMSSGSASLAATLELVGSDRLLFGSDIPFGPPAFVDRCVEALHETSLLSAAEVRAIEAGNFDRLFGDGPEC